MIGNGYIKLWRRVQDSFIWQDPEALKLWVYLLLEANFKDTEFMFMGSKHILKRGQLMRGYRKIAIETHISRAKVGRIISMLKSETLIETRNINICSIISIVKYDDYQAVETVIEPLMRQERDRSETGVRQYRTTKECKNVKNVVLVDGAEAPQPSKKIPPTQEDINNYCIQQHYTFDPKRFFDYYEANGWRVGKNPMRNWQAALRNWSRQQSTMNNESGRPVPEVSPKLAEALRLAEENKQKRDITKYGRPLS